jgi:ATP-dependent DNA ligase
LCRAGAASYFYRDMLHPLRPDGFIEPCQPIGAAKPPSGAGWLHEIKHDGYRLMAQRRGVGGRLLTRNGNDWTERRPSVVAALYALRAPDFGYYPDGYFPNAGWSP